MNILSVLVTFPRSESRLLYSLTPLNEFDISKWTYRVPIQFGDRADDYVVMTIGCICQNTSAFELWLSHHHPELKFTKQLNGEYQEEIINRYKIGWDEASNSTRFSTKYSGDLLSCLSAYREITVSDLEDFKQMEDDGFSDKTFNYENQLIKDFFAGFKAGFMFISLMSKLAELSGKIINSDNIPPYGYKIIDTCWEELIHHKYLSTK